MSARRNKRNVTSIDVARHAGVSQTTVSFVLNSEDTPNIPPETRQRVLDAIADLGYRPNALAQSLRMKRSGTFGFVTDEIAITPHAGKIFEGAQDVAWENGKILMLVNTKANRDFENTAINLLLGRQVEGIIYATMFHHPVNVPAVLRDIPTVLLDCFVEDRQLPSVVPDEYNGGFIATKYLLDHDHRRIGFINNTDDIPATTGRLEGYKSALESYGLPFEPALVTRAKSIQDGGYLSALELLRQKDRPTALFCFNDRMAMGAYDAIRKLNLRIPEDVAVVGFDNQELIAAHLYPSLTTMELPHYQMGSWAAQHLVEILSESDYNSPMQHKIECRLVERESV
jgi:LacI family transcriptional regulator, galactose operon repressor